MMLLKRNYVEGVPVIRNSPHGAAAAMIASLQDPNSRFQSRLEFAEMQREAKGQFSGLGAALAVRTHITPKTADDRPGTRTTRTISPMNSPSSILCRAALRRKQACSRAT